MEPTTSYPILQGLKLTIGYSRGKKHIYEVHKNLDFELMTGELTCLLGPNGVGKSTLLRTIGASQNALGGDIFLDKKPLSTYKEKDIAKSIGLVLTEKTSAGGLTVKELVALGRYPHTGFFGKLGDQDYQIIDDALSAIGCLDKKDRYVAELSDGERQKIMIAKALAQESQIIILDEPTSFLDILSRIEIMHLLRKLARKYNKAILLSTHDLEQALHISDKLWLLSDKRGLICGMPEELIFEQEIDLLFPHQQISFNKLTGSFHFKNRPGKSVWVDGDPELAYWIKNLAERNGFDIRTEKENADIQILAKTKNQIELTNQGETHSETLHSFRDLSVFFQQREITE